MAQIKTNLQYGVTGSLQTGSIAGDAIDGTKIADDAINSEHLAAGGIDTAHIADDQVTLAKMASGTDGNIITYDASGNPAVVATGTSGHFLKSQGADTVPVFAAAGGGKLLQISQKVYGAAAGVTGTTFAYASPMTRNLSALASTSSRVYCIISGGKLGLDNTVAQYKFYGRTGSNSYASIMSGYGMEVTTYNTTPSGHPLAFTYLWSPSTTDTVDVQLWCRASGASKTANVNNADAQIMLTIMEIAG